MSNIWNHKLSGIPGAFFSGVQIFCRRLADKCTTLVVSHNLGSCGKGVIIMQGLTYRNPEQISIGDKAIVGRNCFFTTECIGGGIYL